MVMSVSTDGPVSLIFRFVKREELKKNFSGKEHKSPRISSKEPIKRPVVQRNDTVNLCIIPCKINLKFRIEPEDQRIQYVELLNMMINQLEKIINSKRKNTIHKLLAMQILTKLIQTSYAIVRDVDIEVLEREIEAIKENLNDTS
jgi:hypothetical protein